ncbi:NUDIX domain-containing protein [Streptomyces sp. NPDC051561]|uniref:NUDIX domain-containing protein n=1 Tax=Streptomyces sp. NPDC051561 TaxID=3365658 RepID=UPI00378D4D56
MNPSPPHSHCHHCGTPYPHLNSWPRSCPACHRTAYLNPLPVAVALLPVRPCRPQPGPHTTGLLVITRTIAPHPGQVALPGGFIDHAEDWRQAVVRELREETRIEADAADVRLADALSSPTDHLLLFGLLPAVEETDLPPTAPTDETAGWHILHTPAELAFPLHTQAARAWFAGAYS